MTDTTAQLQSFFAMVLPWPQEGDAAPSYIGIHWTIAKLNERTGKPIWTGRACRSVQEAVNTVQWALKSADTRDIYFCTSSQSQALEKQSKKGNKYLTPIRSQENVVALKSLFLDLDAKGEDKNSYANLQDAVAALTAFIKSMDLPKPSALITSGGGIHCYWSFDRALTIDEWKPLAFALAEATKRHGLRCDTQVTIDSARILRPPCTSNRKLDTPRPVALAGGRVGHNYALDRLDRVLEPYKVAVPATTSNNDALFPRRAPIQGDDELSAGIDRTNAQPIDLNSVLPHCAFLADAVTSGGKDLANPLWNITTLISCFTAGGRAEAHKMACGHPAYTRDSTDELFDRKERERAAKGLGWPSCRTISGSGASQCASCPHFAAGKSPLNLAVKPAPRSPSATNSGPSVQGAGVSSLPATSGAGTTAVGSALPVGYKRLSNNIVCRIIINSDGSATDEPICTYPIVGGWLQNDPDWSINFHTITQVGSQAQISIPLKETATKDRMTVALLMRGMALRENESKHVREFFMSWIQELQKHKASVIGSAPFGWAEQANGIIEGFVFAGHKFTPSGAQSAKNPDPALQRQYSQRGDRKNWIEAAKLITDQRRPQLDAIIASAFAGPLVRFTNEPGILMAVYSQESGAGKTTAMKVAQAVWGHPRDAMQGLDDTNNHVVRKMGKLRHLPVYWDELKSEQDHKEFVKLVFKLTREKEKGRLQQTTEFSESGNWQTMMVSASNASIMDYVHAMARQTQAGAYRVFEYQVTKVPPTALGQIDQADASKIRGKLDNNFGVIGAEYAAFLGQRHAKIEEEVEAFYKSVGEEMNVVNEERFWRVIVATLLQGAAYANALGFTDIDVKGLKAFLINKVMADMRKQQKNTVVDMRNQLNISHVLAQFLAHARAKHTLWTNIIHRKPGKPPANSVKVVRDASRLEAVYVHIGIEDKMMRFSSHYFAQWLEKEGYSRFMYNKSLVEVFGAKEVSGRIAGGTAYVNAQERLTEIDLAANPSINIIDEA